MKSLKKIMFFLFFSLMAAHAMGKDNISFLVYQPLIENIEEDGSGKGLTSEQTESDQEFTLNELTRDFVILIICRISPTDINFLYHYTRSFWQPPKIS